MSNITLEIAEITQKHKDRFLESIEMNGPLREETDPIYSGLGRCWVWKRQTDKDGYGILRIGRNKRKAHRVAFALKENRSLIDEFVIHSCDNPSCVRPSHLSAGTSQQNHEDMEIKGRIARGEKSGMSKLKDSDIPKIIEMRASGKTWPEISQAFNVSRATVRCACIGVTWTHIKRGEINSSLSRDAVREFEKLLV